MARICFITGGQRSGKSGYAQRRAREEALALGRRPLYLAPARVLDDEMRLRVGRHRLDRGVDLDLLEEELRIDSPLLAGRVAVVDCLTLWLANLCEDLDYRAEAVLDLAKERLTGLSRLEGSFYVVSNEIGLGLHGPDRESRTFTDLQGWVNQYAASLADEAYLMVSGLPLTLKG